MSVCELQFGVAAPVVWVRFWPHETAALLLPHTGNRAVEDVEVLIHAACLMIKC